MDRRLADFANDFPDRLGDDGATDRARDVEERVDEIVVPQHADVLPDGEDTLVSGDPEGLEGLNHLQGDNPYGFLGDCGLVSVQDILNQFEADVTEGDVVGHAIEHGECYIDDSDPTQSGGTTLENQVEILGDYGVSAHAEVGDELGDLAADLEGGHGVILEVNAGVLWNDAAYYDNGEANHAIVLTGVARDPNTGEIQGFYVNDSGSGDSGRFVDAATMEMASVDAGGEAVVTDAVAPVYGTGRGV